MDRETRPSKRVKRTPSTVERKGKERLKAIRKNATTTKDTHTVNVEMDFATLRNDGANNIKINFGTDNMTNNYFTLLPDSTPIKIAVFKDAEIHYESVGGPSKLEIILEA